MNLKIKLLLPFFIILAARAMAADSPALSVAVYDFTGEAKARSYGSKVTALVTADLTTHTNLILLERADLNKALTEQAFGKSGMVSSDAAAKVGAITGAKVLVSGQVILLEKNHLVVVASIIGTETGRLFAAKVEGAATDLTRLTSDLSSQIAQTIALQTTNLIMEARESDAARLDRIVKGITGTNRPSVLLAIHYPRGPAFLSAPANAEMGVILQKAGFTVLDANSDRKPDVEITGVINSSAGPSPGELFSNHAILELKVQERRTGNIITIDRQESIATDATRGGADWSAQMRAVDDIAERVLPLLAK